MPWEEKTVKQSRSDFVQDVLSEEKTISELCREYGISRKTGYKWLHRFENGEGLSDQSKVPFHTPNKTSGKVERLILDVRDAHPAWGARKLKHFLERRGNNNLPAASTICDILKRNGYVSLEESRKHRPYQRFERAKPNELWQTDFKGDFGMLNGERCHALTVLDDHSRYSLCVDAKGNERAKGVLASFSRLFMEYGLPKSILCDNGNPWGTSQSVGYTKFEVWLMDLNILPIHGRPMHPQTQGKEERFHRTMEAELLRYKSFADLTEAQKSFDAFRNCYNTERPHEALGYDVPSQHYQASVRRMPNEIDKWEYTNGYDVRKIKSSGYITYRGQGYFLSEAFGGREIEVKERDGGRFDLLYRNFRVGQIDVDERVIVSRKLYRAKGERKE